MWPFALVLFLLRHVKISAECLFWLHINDLKMQIETWSSCSNTFGKLTLQLSVPSDQFPSFQIICKVWLHLPFLNIPVTVWKYTHNERKSVASTDEQGRSPQHKQNYLEPWKHHIIGSVLVSTQVVLMVQKVCVCECVKGVGGTQFYGMTDMSQHSEAQVLDTGGRVSRMIHNVSFKNLLGCVCRYKDSDMWRYDASSWFQLLQQQQPKVERELTTEQRSTETGHTRQASPLRWYKVTQSFYDTVKTKQCCRH